MKTRADRMAIPYARDTLEGLKPDVPPDLHPKAPQFAVKQRTWMSFSWIREAGRIPVERNTLYNDPDALTAG
jgi:2-iminoacetate synthase ThiH